LAANGEEKKESAMQLDTAPISTPVKAEIKSGIFIHSDLDESWLLPSEFRVLGHVARRAGDNGVCNAGIKSIAKICRLKEATVRIALKSLTSQSFLIPKERSGASTEYRLAPRVDWKPSNPLPKTEPLTNKGRGLKHNLSPYEKGRDYPLRNRGDEVTPIEVTPIKGNPRGASNEFIKPSIETAIAFFKQQQATQASAKKFFNHYESKNWKDIAKWQPLAENWIARDKEKSTDEENPNELGF
jgi:hypothetical protein